MSVNLDKFFIVCYNIVKENKKRMMVFVKKVKIITKASTIIVAFAAILFLFTGCSKTSATSDDFKLIAEENGMVTVDAKSQFADYDYILEAIIAAPEDNTYQIEFYVLSDSSFASSFFENNKAKFEQSKGSDYSYGSSSGQNYSTYSLTAGERYMFVEQVDNTVIYIDVDKSYKDEVSDFVKALKY